MAGVGILANGVTEILKGLSILVAKEIGLARGVNDELSKLKKTLDLILAVMDDAEKKQVKNKAVRMWLEELKDIAYEAEDILDDYSYQVFHRRQMKRKRDRVSRFFTPNNSLLFRQQIAHQIENINEKLNKHAMIKETLGLQMLELGPTDHDESSKLREDRETDSIIDQSFKIIGRDKHKSNITKMLLHNDSQNQHGNIQVIPIVGMGGVGKTTLAQSIFNDKTVENYFDLKIWVCVSDEFDVKKLFVKIIESIKYAKCDNVSNIDVIARQLQKCLTGKKYLLVLDDVWNKKPEAWVRLKKPLLMGGSGSKILVTTRSEEVASIMGVGLQFLKLEILDEDQSWSLFRERIFGYSGGVVETPNLITIGKELVKKCGGLPLALIFLVSLLRNKEENKWKVINEDKIWVKSYGEGETRILPILKLSYDHLPSCLKQCFSYFSLFPKDYCFHGIGMILLWMAEGFLPQPSPGNTLSMEEVGNEYLNSLSSNSFFQDVKKDVFGLVQTFSMHDLVHDLAIYVAGDCECISWVADRNMKSILSVRHLRLSVEREGPNFNEIMANFHNKSKLSTLLVFDKSIKKIENNAFDGVMRLRVLGLHDARDLKEISSSSMSNLKHLRYLNLSSTEIRNLPESVMSLYHLQTLDLRGCLCLNELPRGIGKLINLRHLYLPVQIISIPREIGKLSSLQTLCPFNVGTSYNKDGEEPSSGGRREVVPSCGIEILEGLNLLNDYIQINFLQNVTSGTDAERANLKGKKYLNQMLLNWQNYGITAREDIKDEAVLEALEPHPNLKYLVIDAYLGVRFTRWMGDPSRLPNLVILTLINCRKCVQVVGFGKLPSLKKLELIRMNGIRCLGNEFYGNSDGGGGGSSSSSSSSSSGEAAGVSVVLFPSLKELVLEQMESLEEWVDIPPSTTTTVNYSCFPCLEEIKIDICPKLRITPTRFPSIKKLSLRAINEKVAVPLITTNLNSLDSVYLGGIQDLRFLPHRLLQGSNLKELDIFNCSDFQGFHPNEKEEEEEERFTSLKVLRLHLLRNLKFLPDIRSFTSLEDLFIKHCRSFKPIPECLSKASLKHLKKVHIENVKEVKDFEWENVMGEIAEYYKSLNCLSSSPKPEVEYYKSLNCLSSSPKPEVEYFKWENGMGEIAEDFDWENMMRDIFEEANKNPDDSGQFSSY